mgnify:CR=1 FL=1
MKNPMDNGNDLLIKQFGLFAIAAVGYYALAQLGFLFAFTTAGGSITLVWLPSGWALAMGTSSATLAA